MQACSPLPMHCNADCSFFFLQACYTIAPPGKYVALLLLDFTNVFVLTSHNPDCCNPERGRQRCPTTPSHPGTPQAHSYELRRECGARNLVKATLGITVHPSPTPLPDWPR